MKVFTGFLLFCAFFASVVFYVAERIGPKVKADHTFRIMGQNMMGTWFCSAFAITDKEALTARHCVEEILKRPPGVLFDDSGAQYKISYVDGTHDVAIITGDFRKRNKLKLSLKLSVPGDVVTSCGFPNGIQIKRCMKSTITATDLFIMRLEGPMIPGMSGGPVVNAEGEVVGINALVYPVEMGGGSGYSHAGVVNK